MLATNISIHPTNWLATHFQSTAYKYHQTLIYVKNEAIILSETFLRFTKGDKIYISSTMVNLLLAHLLGVSNVMPPYVKTTIINSHIPQ